MQMRVAVLWPTMSGYIDSCLRALAAGGAEVFLSSQRSDSTAPFDAEQFSRFKDAYTWTRKADAAELRRRIQAFAPDVVLVSSWHLRPYRAQLRPLAGQAVRVLCMDNQWRAAPKQWVGRATSRIYLAPLYDVAFVPGERQVTFARMLGFEDERIWRGLYVGDQPKFDGGPRPVFERRSFVFAGRLVPAKAIDVLAEAYRRYGMTAPHPWPLHVYGTGPEEHLLRGLPGVDLRGFIQPEDLPAALRAGSCLVLPSRFEPWGVVVHEAASAGMVLLCSTRVGAAVHLLQDRWNGLLVAPDDPTALAARLREISSYDDARLQAMQEASRLLSQQLTPARWARDLRERVAAVRPALLRSNSF